MWKSKREKSLLQSLTRTHSHQSGTPTDLSEMRTLRYQKGRPPIGDLHPNGTPTFFLQGRRRRVCVWFDWRRRERWTHPGIKVVHQGRIFRTEKGCHPADAVSGSERKTGSDPDVGLFSTLHNYEGALMCVAFFCDRRVSLIQSFVEFHRCVHALICSVVLFVLCSHREMMIPRRIVAVYRYECYNIL
jgi:hypothetical protein